MDEWIEQNIQKLASLDSVFVTKDNKIIKSAKVLDATPQQVELNDFFEDNVDIFFTEDFTKHIISLKIDKLSNRGTTIFNPIEHKEIQVERSTKRYTLETRQDPIIITNILSDFEIAAMIEFNNTKVERITYTFQEALLKYFKSAEIYFFHEIMTSARGKTIKEFRKPIFISKINDPGSPENNSEKCIPGGVYFKRIKPFDRKIPPDAISDVTVPIYFNRNIPYGFIQVCSNKQVKREILDQLQNIAEKLNQQLLSAKIFEKSVEKVMVTDMSSLGLGTLFKNRKLVTIFKPNALVSFDLVFPGNQVLAASGFCRNVVGAGQGKIKAGLEFAALSGESSSYINTFLTGLQ